VYISGPVVTGDVPTREGPRIQRESMTVVVSPGTEKGLSLRVRVKTGADHSAGLYIYLLTLAT